MKIWYFKNIHRDESKDILYDIIYLYILIKKYDQSKISQTFIFLNKSSITYREGLVYLKKEYYFKLTWLCLSYPHINLI